MLSKLRVTFQKYKTFLNNTATVKLFKKHPRRSALAALFLCTVFFGVLTSIVFLNRAGSSFEQNWPAKWELSNSDNGVLFQFSKDVFTGQKLEWGFSPQVYVFPEIPISLAAYALSFGDVYVYFIMVAIINNCLLFLALHALSRIAFRVRSSSKHLQLGFLAGTPLLILPLLSSNTVFSYHLAPTYYFGAYLLTLLLPLVFWAKRRWVRTLVGTAYILTAASNPLLLVFSMPALAITLLVTFLKSGFRPVIKSGAIVATLVAASMALRKILFSGLVGTSAGNYISIDLFAKRLNGMHLLIRDGFNNYYDKYLLYAGILLLILSCAAVIYYARMYSLQKSSISMKSDQPSYQTLLYLSALPIVTALVLYNMTIINGLYIWIIMLVPFLAAPFYLTPKLLSKVAPIALLTLLALLALPSSLARYSKTENYFAYQPPVAQCLDKNLPSNLMTGYSTFSDARKNSLVSKRQVRLVPILPATNPNNWLTNARYISDNNGSFFVINNKGDEPALLPGVIQAEFGQPDQVFTCETAVTVYLYNKQSAIEEIDAFYDRMYTEGKRK